jgi:hypothetical protein
MKISIAFDRSLLYFTSVTLAIFALFLSSCEKVIHLDLNTAEKKYVIEATVTDQPGTAQVLLSETKNFDDNNQFVGVSGGVITVKEEGGLLTTFTETFYCYFDNACKGKPGFDLHNR